MTREDVKDLLKFIIRKCDLIINNESYTADDYVQDNIEDIAEICHRVLGGQFGEIVSNSEGPDESLEEAANNYASKTECAVVACRGFKAGAEWREKQDGSRKEANVKIANTDVLVDYNGPRDIWEYVNEFIRKFGRIPKDVDELSACVDYVIAHKSIDEKKEKPVRWPDLTCEDITKVECTFNDEQKEQKPADLSEMMVHKEPYIAPVPTPMVADEQKPAAWSEDWREEDIQTRFAFYTYKDDPSVLYLSNVFVEETSRNHGFGTRILRAAEKSC